MPLRPPTKEEYAKGLPKTKEEAIKQGITRFIPEDGEERIIRRYGSKQKPQGGIERASSRKGNRGSNRRQEYETLSTPPEARQGAAKQEYNKAMVTARQQGLVGDHVTDVARSGKALSEMLPERQALYHQRFKDAGVPLGNQASNITPVTEYTNGTVKNSETRALDKALKQLEKKSPLWAAYARRTEFLGSALNESNPLGGSKISTDPLGILGSPDIAIP